MILTGALVNGLAIVAAGVLGTLGGKLMPGKMKQTVVAATALVSIGICLNALYRPKGRGSTPPLRCHCEPVRRLVARSVPHPAQNHGPPASPEGRFIR